MTNAPLTVAALRDIVEPPPIGIWPLATGLWVLLGIAAIAAGLLIRQIIRRRQLDAYRRAGLDLLQEVAAELSPADALLETSVILKRVALVVFPREAVAPLYGTAWLEFLDRSCRGTHFGSDSGREWIAVIQGTRPADTVDADLASEVLTMARSWIRGHRVPDADAGHGEAPAC